MEGCGCINCTCELAYQIPKNQNFIQIGEFPLHSGGVSYFKLECDKFTQTDWEALAFIASKRWRFRSVHGIPTGGMRLAAAMRQYETHDSRDPVMIVDDVLTSGGSLTQARAMYNADDFIIGYVAIARRPTLPWVVPFFQVTEGWE